MVGADLALRMLLHYVKHFFVKNIHFECTEFAVKATNIFASMQENLSSGGLQTTKAHPCSLISAFVIHLLKSIISGLVMSESSIF